MEEPFDPHEIAYWTEGECREKEWVAGEIRELDTCEPRKKKQRGEIDWKGNIFNHAF